jgi:heptose-I-phosphate ethanolaminephosphotransferase
VLPEFEMALLDGARRKLIFVHLLGAHPHYRLRYPPGHAPFRGTDDVVHKQLKLSGRSAWIRTLRDDYDTAIHFHDHVLDRTIDLTKRLGGNAGWIFLSDHGQEVGNGRDHAGHSTASADGYRIPLLMWGAITSKLPAGSNSVPIRSDWLGHTIVRLLGIEWKKYRPERDFLDPQYQWLPPLHPISIDYLS